MLIVSNRYYLCGPYFGKILCIVIAVQVIFLQILRFMYPAKDIDAAPIIELKQRERKKNNLLEQVRE
jgi:accessory gene regulator protein AgrB